MTDLVSYELKDSIATITMDDGKANALSLDMLGQIDAAFDRAESDNAIVILTGREGRFSGGFDLKGLMGQPDTAAAMLRAGFELSARMLSYPRPVVVGCSGHAIAMGVFLVLSGDYRIGVGGPYKFTANEVAIGLTMPAAAIEVCHQRLAPAHFHRAVILAEVYSPEDAVAAGFLDSVVELADLAAAAREKAEQLGKLNPTAHTATKMRVREQSLATLHAAIEADQEAFKAMVRGG
jgi:enoyl-CoA hydratase